MTAFERLYILSVPFHNVSFEETVAWATERMVNRRPGGIVVTPNLDFMFSVSRDPVLRRLVCESDLVVADGMPAVWLSRVLGPGLKERVTGSDLTPRLLEVCAERGLSVFAIGGAPGVAEKAFDRMRERLPGLKVAGALSPPMAPFEKMDLQAIGERVRQADPHLVLVAMGMGKQEKLMDWLRSHTQVPLMMGVGGSLDFLAGVQTRAPRWVQRCGLEWVWRTGTSPGRFIGRYTKDGVWLLSVLSRLLWCRLGVAARRPGGEPAPSSGEGGGPVLRFPEIRSGAQQGAFLDAAGSREWSALDLGAREWLSSLELAALALLEMRASVGGRHYAVLNVTARLRRQLACVGLSGVGVNFGDR